MITIITCNDYVTPCSVVRQRQPIFPKNSLLTREHWEEGKHWRKKTCYGTVSRIAEDCVNYKSWNNFRWCDYTQRNALMKTFVNRHLPITNGTTPLDTKLLPDPKEWRVPPMPDFRPPPERDLPGGSYKKRPLVAPPTLVWDDEQEEWVKNTNGTENPATQPSCSPKRRPNKRKKKTVNKGSKKKTRRTSRRSPRKHGSSALDV